MRKDLDSQDKPSSPVEGEPENDIIISSYGSGQSIPTWNQAWAFPVLSIWAFGWLRLTSPPTKMLKTSMGLFFSQSEVWTVVAPALLVGSLNSVGLGPIRPSTGSRAATIWSTFSGSTVDASPACAMCRNGWNRGRRICGFCCGKQQ